MIRSKLKQNEQEKEQLEQLKENLGAEEEVAVLEAQLSAEIGRSLADVPNSDIRDSIAEWLTGASEIEPSTSVPENHLTLTTRHSEDRRNIPIFTQDSSIATTNHNANTRVTWTHPASSLNAGAREFEPRESKGAATYRSSVFPQHNFPQRSYNPAVSFTNNGHLDAATGHLALLDLKKAPPCPFKGNAHEYHSWVKSLMNRMRHLQLSSIDKIDIFEAHTEGAPRELVRTFRSAFASNPDLAIDVILGKLKDRFGSDVEVASQLRAKIESMPEIRGSQSDTSVSQSLRKMSDLCIIINAYTDTVPDLQTFNYATGIESLRRKLPDFINNKWRIAKAKYTEKCHGHPPFNYFCDFLEEKADQLCSDVMQKTPHAVPKVAERSPRKEVVVLQTSKLENDRTETSRKCPLHQTDGHSLSECSVFAGLTLDVKRLLLRGYGLCYRCLGNHIASQCPTELRCETCNSTNHSTTMHSSKPGKFVRRHSYSGTAPSTNRRTDGNRSHHPLGPDAHGAAPSTYMRSDNNGNPQTLSSDVRAVNTTSNESGTTCCTAVCGMSGGRSCGKTILVDVSIHGSPEKFRAYAIVDEQSTNSFATSYLLDKLGIDGPIQDYHIRTLSGDKSTITGRTARGLNIKGVTESRTFKLPTLYENNNIPDTKHEVATPEALGRHRELSRFADNFPSYDEDAKVLLLIGRDSGDILTTKTKTNHSPIVHQTALGWAIVGSICPEESLVVESSFTTLRTAIYHDHYSAEISFPMKNVFKEHPDDDSDGLSTDDRRFLDIVVNNIRAKEGENIELPLPFKNNAILPDNRAAVFYRQSNTLRRLKANPIKLQNCLKAMQKSIDSNHVEKLPKECLQTKKGEVWYLPIFPVIHPKKLKTRLVFDSAASYKGVSLNSVLLQGPDQNNRLRGVLCRFREEEFGFVADVESMFHSFRVPVQSRDYMRFYWYDENDPHKELVQYRALVHIFGNTCSPSISTIGLRRAADSLNDDSSPENREINMKTKKFIFTNFYVDDGLGCASSTDEAIGVLSTAKETLKRYNIHLHKIVSNSAEVLRAFPASERGEISAPIDLDDGCEHRTLGVAWDVTSDKFLVKVQIPDRPFTKRGILAVINSIYDPIGIASPVVLGGRLFQRKIFPRKEDLEESIYKYEWDEPLPKRYLHQWEQWKDSLRDLASLTIPRCLKPGNFGPCAEQTLHVFSDASELAIGHVMYIRSVCLDANVHVSFLYGESKVAPRAATTVPRLELCAAVEAAQSCRRIVSEMSLIPSKIYFYTDSKIVLGYLRNNTRRFSKYVTRRVETILRLSLASQWQYVTSSDNPADIATRPLVAEELRDTTWLSGPHFIREDSMLPIHFVPDEELPEVEPVSTVLCTVGHEDNSVFDTLFQRTTDWKKILRTIGRVLSLIWKISDKVKQRAGTSLASRHGLSSDASAHDTAILEAQRVSFPEVFVELSKSGFLPANHTLARLTPFTTEDSGILRVGGRLKKTSFPLCVKHPILLPRNHPISSSILQYYHEKSCHQGRTITQGAITEAGYYLQGGRQVIRAFLNSCVVCRKLRASCEQQLMSDLPSDRVETVAPFTNSGVDVMGPWDINEGRHTRLQKGTKKTWAVLFTCLVSRSVHVEPLPCLDVPTFVNALRRFLATRGNCKLLRSDRGTNFTGTSNQEIDIQTLSKSCSTFGCKWEFNPPHASHFGGVWERKIGQLKRALDAAILKNSHNTLNRDELYTLLQESAAIVNSTPLWEVSDDPNDPQPLTPSMLLTMKEPIGSPVAESFATDLSLYGKRRWKRVQFLAEEFWKLWRASYLQTLQVRQKWLTKKDSIEADDVVLLREKNCKRNEWPMGVVETVKTSHDGLVRSVTLRVVRSSHGTVKNFTYERPISEIVLLQKRKS